MLCNAALLIRRTLQTWRVIVQLNLSFLDLPLPQTCLWELLDQEQRTIVIEAIARLITKTATNNQEQNNDRHL
jgi:hypothetical protein